MNLMEKFRKTPDLKWAVYAYLLLGATDTLHHFHAAVVLGQESAIHAVWTGVVLIPIAIFSVAAYLKYDNRVLFWVFVAIALLAGFVPGLYHGGWDHFVKILGHLRISSESTSIHTLFPADNLNLWVYEISGSLEFLFGIFTIYFTGRACVSTK